VVSLSFGSVVDVLVILNSVSVVGSISVSSVVDEV
jgi:hypothetical protein